MSDSPSPETELRRLEEKRLTAGLTPEEEARLAELTPPSAGFDVNAAAAAIRAASNAAAWPATPQASGEPPVEGLDAYAPHTQPLDADAPADPATASWDVGAPPATPDEPTAQLPVAPPWGEGETSGTEAEALLPAPAGDAEEPTATWDVGASAAEVVPPPAAAPPADDEPDRLDALTSEGAGSFAAGPAFPGEGLPPLDLGVVLPAVDAWAVHAVPPGDPVVDLGAFEGAPEVDRVATRDVTAGGDDWAELDVTVDVTEIADGDIVEVGEETVEEVPQPDAAEVAPPQATAEATVLAASPELPLDPEPAADDAADAQPSVDAAPPPAPEVAVEEEPILETGPVLEGEPILDTGPVLDLGAAVEEELVGGGAEVGDAGAADAARPPVEVPALGTAEPLLNPLVADAVAPDAPPAAVAPPAPEEVAPAHVAGRHRVVLHTMDGQVKRGAVADAALDAPEVVLEPQPGGAPESIPAERIKAIFFMLPLGDPPLPPQGKKVRVTFRDGRQVAGFSPDYDAERAGFFMIPADTRTHTARIWVYRSAVRQVVVS